MMTDNAGAQSGQLPFSHRSFAPEEVDVLVREIQALRADEQKRVPYAQVREMLAEAGVEPDRLDTAISRLDGRKSAHPPVEWLRQWGWVAAAVLLASVCLLTFAALRPAQVSPVPVAAAAIVAPAKRVPARSAPPMASAEQLRELQKQALLFAETDDYRLVVHNPFKSGVRRLLLRIDSVAFGRRFNQRFWFDPYDSVPSYESADLRVPHELSGAPEIRSWKIEAAEFSGERRAKE